MIEYITDIDPKNPEHINAVKKLIKTGVWPEGFINHDNLSTSWIVDLFFLFTQEYINEFEKGNILT